MPLYFFQNGNDANTPSIYVMTRKILAKFFKKTPQEKNEVVVVSCF
jgi:hypothetical protein